MSIFFLVIATGVTFTAFGAVLGASVTTTIASHQQQRLQRKFRRWHDEVIRLEQDAPR